MQPAHEPGAPIAAYPPDSLDIYALTDNDCNDPITFDPTRYAWYKTARLCAWHDGTQMHENTAVLHWHIPAAERPLPADEATADARLEAALDNHSEAEITAAVSDLFAFMQAAAINDTDNKPQVRHVALPDPYPLTDNTLYRLQVLPHRTKPGDFLLLAVATGDDAPATLQQRRDTLAARPRSTYHGNPHDDGFCGTSWWHNPQGEALTIYLAADPNDPYRPAGAAIATLNTLDAIGTALYAPIAACAHDHITRHWDRLRKRYECITCDDYDILISAIHKEEVPPAPDRETILRDLVIEELHIAADGSAEAVGYCHLVEYRISLNADGTPRAACDLA